jgi:nitric oxide synthase-interacting protein
MTRHSKNNTAGAFFTSSERGRLSQYGTQHQRVARDSFRRPDACYVCLQPAIEPLCCPEGHLFCKECILQSLITQKKTIATQQQAFEAQQARQQAEAEEERSTELKRRITEFESNSKRQKTTDSANTAPSTTKAQLNAFWMPSKTPTAASTIISAPKKETFCPASDHPVTMKRMTFVKWTIRDEKCICKLCFKDIALVNGIVLFTTCGHTICKKCCEQVGTLDKCLDCGVNSSIVNLVFDGTGFAGAGGNVDVKKHTPAFI